MGHWAGLRPAERIAALGAVLMIGSLLFPWYGIELELFSGFSQTGLEAFGFGHGALVATAAAALLLIVRCGAGYRPPRPLDEGALLILAAIWGAVVVAYLAIDRPDEIAGFTTVRLRYGLFVALGGAAALLSGGVRLRQAPDGREGRNRSDEAPGV
jgi:hypothetical protein